jgi:hypothetical protein
MFTKKKSLSLQPCPQRGFPSAGNHIGAKVNFHESSIHGPSQQHLVLNHPLSTEVENQITEFQAESSGPQLYLEKPNLTPHTAQNMTCLHLTASTYALVPDLKT